MAPPDAPLPVRPMLGFGRVLVWQGGSAWISRATGQADAHAHHAIQITLAQARPVRLQDATQAGWRESHAAIVMPDQPHRFDGCGQDVALLFVEPETTVGRALIARFGRAPLSTLDDPAVREGADALLGAFAAGADDAALMRHARGIIDGLAGPLPGAAPVDPRVTAATEWIRQRLGERISLDQAAAVAHLSPGRFRHLFVAQTGISFRAYLLWTRVSHAVAAGLAGGSWTDAAQQAGFADSAHLSRTCRRMFGIAPTMLGRG